MGREIRRVTANWNHPKNKEGYFIPLYGRNFSNQLERWEKENLQWINGFISDFKGGWILKSDKEKNMIFEEWHGKKPLKEDYMPEWNDTERTHIQLYENTTEGTPISEVYKVDDFEKLCEYAAKNCTTFASFKASKEEWMKMLESDFFLISKNKVLFL